MLHQIKRTVGLAQQPLKGPANAEYLDLRQRLSAIKSALKYTSDMLDYANKGWILQMQAQRTFSERFVESYPSPGDEMHVIASQFADGSQRLYDHFIRKSNADMTAYHNIHHQVTVYIREIENVEAYHSRLIAAKSEADRYQSKIDHMERKKKQTDESKKTRNLLKMDVEKVNYRKLLSEAIEKQKATYAKYPIVFKAALVSYWLSHEKHVTMLVESLKETQAFAKAAEAEMAQLDIKKMEMPFQKDIHVMHKVNGSVGGEHLQRETDLRQKSASFANLAQPKDSIGSSVGMKSSVSEGDALEQSRLLKARSLVHSQGDAMHDISENQLLKTRSLRERRLEKKRSVNIEGLKQSKPIAPVVEKQKRDPAEPQLEGNFSIKDGEVKEKRPGQEDHADRVNSMKASEIITSHPTNSHKSQGSISSNERILSDKSFDTGTVNSLEKLNTRFNDPENSAWKTFTNDEAVVRKKHSEKDNSINLDGGELKTSVNEESDVVKARTVKDIAGIYEAGQRKTITKTTQQGL